MKDLIKALQILSNYGNPQWPTHCEHDVLHVNIEFDLVSPEDIGELNELGFFESDHGTFMSYRFGSC